MDLFKGAAGYGILSGSQEYPRGEVSVKGAKFMGLNWYDYLNLDHITLLEKSYYRSMF